MTSAHVPTFLSLFAGVGGFDLALERAGWRCLLQCELDPFCARVLAARWPGVPRWGDLRTMGLPQGDEGARARRAGTVGAGEPDGCADGAGWDGPDHVDLLCGGFPCQDFSVAGKRAGLDGYRGTLFWEIIRIAKILHPAWGLFENVPGLISSRRGREFWAVLEGLRECWPAVGWRVLDSQHFGVPQRRRRLFVVGGPSVEAVRAVLFEPEGGGGDSPAGGDAGADVAGPLGGGAYGTGRRREDDPNVIVASLDTRPNADRAGEETRLVVGAIGYDKAKGGWRAGPDEAMAGQLVVGQQHGSDVGRMGALRSGRGDVQSGVPFVTHTLRPGGDGGEDGTGRGTPLVVIPLLEINGGATTRGEGPNGAGIGRAGDPMFTLQAEHQHGVGRGALVRRLTPLECERLQAFPDGWTCLDVPLSEYAVDPEGASERCRCPDSPRYRAMGNAVTVTVVEWLARRLMALADGAGGGA